MFLVVLVEVFRLEGARPRPKLRERESVNRLHTTPHMLRMSSAQRVLSPEGQGGHPARPAATDLRRQTAGGRSNSLGLQHPEGEYPSPGAAPAWWHADLREDADGQDHHARCRSERHYRQRL